LFDAFLHLVNADNELAIRQMAREVSGAASGLDHAPAQSLLRQLSLPS